MKVRIYYGSTIGDTESIAQVLGEKLGAEVVPISLGIKNIDCLDLILFGSSTWGYGELQDDWGDRINILGNINLSGKKIGIFGTGDQESYEDTFCDAMGIIGKAARNAGGEIIGMTSKEGYNFSNSKALENNQLIGLALDINNQDDLTSSRIEEWVDQLKKEV
ncbi:MAG: flavodoxin [Psychrilyobacter sp.]|uniref:flavodoxin n=1 Tax=Psychrilyobacter sp. TaxID=2586924 RepID=UPI003C736A9B